MYRIKTAIRFIHKSYLSIKGHSSFQQYLIGYAVVGFVLLILWFVPLALIVSLIGLSPVGLVLIGFVVLLMLLSVIIWGRITMLQVISVFDAQIQSETYDDTLPAQQKWLVRQLGDAALFAFSLPGLRIRKFFGGLSKTTSESGDSWLGSAYLVWPLMAVESLSLVQAIDRLKNIVQEKLIRFQPGLIPVLKVTSVFQWLLIVLGGWIGFVVGMHIADPLETTGIIPILGSLIGVIIAGIFTLIGIHINTFARACYFASLYRWVKNVETANITGIPEKATPPAILSQAMGKINKKER